MHCLAPTDQPDARQQTHNRTTSLHGLPPLCLGLPQASWAGLDTLSRAPESATLRLLLLLLLLLLARPHARALLFPAYRIVSSSARGLPPRWNAARPRHTHTHTHTPPARLY